MLTEEKEDYLKAIYQHNGMNEYVANKQIAAALNIKPPSVSEMMTRLEKEGYVSIKPYKGVKITKKGTALTLQLIRRHRLIECFLIESLKYTWDEVHEEAEILEHKVSDKFIDRLDEMLSYPKYCPHGSIIPRGSETDEDDAVPLTDINEDETFTLMRVNDEYELLGYLSEQDVSIGDKLTMMKVDSANRVVHLKNDAASFILSEDNAKKIYVKK